MRRALTFSLMFVALFVVPMAMVDAQVLSNPQGGIPEQIVPKCEGDSCDFDKLMELAQNLLNFMIFIGIILSALMFAYAGFLYTTHAGNQSKIEDAKKIFGYVIGGLVIMLVAWLGIDTLLRTLTGKGFNERQGGAVPSALTLSADFGTLPPTVGSDC